MADELSAVEKAIDDLACASATIAALVGTQVYSETADQDATEPYLIFKFLAGSDVQGIGTQRVMSAPLVLITLVYEGAATLAIRTALTALDTLFGELVSQSVTLDTGESFRVSARREMPFKMVETDKQAQKKYTHKGGKYRFEVSVT